MPNYAYKVAGYGVARTEGQAKRWGRGARGLGTRLFYWLACGHMSKPGIPVCSQDCSRPDEPRVPQFVPRQVA